MRVWDGEALVKIRLVGIEMLVRGGRTSRAGMS